ncbi:flagellar biosynthesis anti-sigma factor FlgM [Sphingosinicella sp. LHD-64]|uniref:flagellar biosynthesis anti-sigma factor FlgM n=1 Tax=Sphingosinicella sp. LHD-64 TaxID=3072139 RepID=UPI002810369C|nr:flagellar biosynthesis anti-sigma factor FlgM [Sphingosinicella sp. LHD-64]MDQ8757179.1 flagellar biosynthesis anti-sigma factor FlgM [Sphingosinicella sp. LHD-64]
MIDGVGKTGPGRIELTRGTEKSQAAAATGHATSRGRNGPVESAVFELVSGGAPVDSAKVSAIRAAIAEGRYPVDADRIAERMIALDLPVR